MDTEMNHLLGKQNIVQASKTQYRHLHSLVNHLAKIHCLVSQLSPPPAEYNLKYGSH